MTVDDLGPSSRRAIATVAKATHEQPPTTGTPAPATDQRAAAAPVLRSPDYGHSWALNKAAFNLGRPIGARILSGELAEQTPQPVGETVHTSPENTADRIAAAIRSGINAGIGQPRRDARGNAA